MKSEYIKPVAEVVKFQPTEEITAGLALDDYDNDEGSIFSFGEGGLVWQW